MWNISVYRTLILASCLIIVPSLALRSNLQTIIGSQIDYADFKADELAYLNDNDLLNEAVHQLPQQLIVTYKGPVEMVFAMPKYLSGGSKVPFTLGSVTSNITMKPYPNFWTNNKVCDGIYSASSMYKDRCNRLWVLDQGIDSIEKPVLKCPPKIVILDMKTKKVVMKYEIPSELYISDTVAYTNLIVDEENDDGSCENMMAIMTEVFQSALTVFNLKEKKAWNVEHASFLPEYQNNTSAFLVGVHSVVLTPKGQNNDRRYMIYSSFHGQSVNRVLLDIVYDHRIWEKQQNLASQFQEMMHEHPRTKRGVLDFLNMRRWGKNKDEDNKYKVQLFNIDKYFNKLGNTGLFQTGLCALTEKLDYLCPVKNGITKWNLKEPFIGDEYIVKNPKTMKNGRSIYITKNGIGEEELYYINNIFSSTGGFQVLGCKLFQLSKDDDVACTVNLCPAGDCKNFNIFGLDTRRIGSGKRVPLKKRKPQLRGGDFDDSGAYNNKRFVLRRRIPIQNSDFFNF